MLLSVVVPIFNEEELICDFINQVTKKLSAEKIDYEFILVENGSTDRTLSILRQLAKSRPQLLVFHLPRPGYGQALKHGLKKAKGGTVIVFNADFWQPEFIKLAKNNLGGADVIIGSKNLPTSEDHRPLRRRLITRLFVTFLRLFLGFKGSDTHGIKAFKRKVLKEILPRCKIKSSLFDSEFLVKAQRAGFKIAEVPVKVREVRPPRFKGRFLSTPKDLCELFLALK